MQGGGNERKERWGNIKRSSKRSCQGGGESSEGGVSWIAANQE